MVTERRSEAVQSEQNRKQVREPGEDLRRNTAGRQGRSRAEAPTGAGEGEGWEM